MVKVTVLASALVVVSAVRYFGESGNGRAYEAAVPWALVGSAALLWIAFHILVSGLREPGPKRRGRKVTGIGS